VSTSNKNKICGCALNFREDGIILSVWIKNGRDFVVIQELKKNLQKILNIGPEFIAFKSHQKSIVVNKLYKINKHKNYNNNNNQQQHHNNKKWRNLNVRGHEKKELTWSDIVANHTPANKTEKIDSSKISKQNRKPNRRKVIKTTPPRKKTEEEETTKESAIEKEIESQIMECEEEQGEQEATRESASDKEQSETQEEVEQISEEEQGEQEEQPEQETTKESESEKEIESQMEHEEEQDVEKEVQHINGEITEINSEQEIETNTEEEKRNNQRNKKSKRRRTRRRRSKERKMMSDDKESGESDEEKKLVLTAKEETLTGTSIETSQLDITSVVYQNMFKVISYGVPCLVISLYAISSYFA